jgi:hypothetical protein
MCFAAATTSGFAAAPKEDNAPPKTGAKAPSIDGVVGKRLISIDGSMISIGGSEGGMSREILAPNGAVQKLNFSFISDKLGTVADSRDAKNVIGVFRMTDSDINIEYADGSSETLSATGTGGVSVETQSAAHDSFCTVWYPEGHTFSIDDRKAALAQYATRLGLGDLGDKKDTPARANCNTSAAPVATPTRTANTSTKTETAAAAAAKPEVVAPKDVIAPKIDSTAAKTEAAAKTDPPKTDTAKTETAAKIEPAAKTDAAKVDPLKLETASAKTDAKDSKSEAAAVPIPTPAPRAAVLASAGAAAAAAKSTVPKVGDIGNAKTIDVRTSEVHPIDPPAAPEAQAEKPQVLASVVPANTAPPSQQRGASSCLTVESDGSHWGFRNHCGFTVQFAYCLMSGGGQLAACKDGAVPGSVSANGFGSLVADESLKETDVAHDFRWVACQGGAGEVIPRLDQTDPPVGRCVR